MGKDREGKYHPPKGKPSGTKTQRGVTNTDSNSLEEQFKIEEKYSIDSEGDDVQANVPVRHPNRNVDKGDEHKLSENKNPRRKSVTEPYRNESVDATVTELAVPLSKEALQDLAAYQGDHCVSIYMPTHKSGVEVNEQMDLIAFKNQLQKIESVFKQKGADQVKTARVLKQAYDFLRADKIWREMSAGLAVFLGDGFFKFIRMPGTTTEILHINSTFFLSPLLPVLNNQQFFFLLIISKKRSNLFRVDNFGIRHIEIKELPNGIDDVVHFEEKDDQKLFRTGSSGAGQGANYHGIGAGKPDEKENISMYLDEVDETLRKEILGTSNVPLLLGGVDYLIPIFKKVSRYKTIWETSLTGNLEHENEQVLYDQARKLMEPYFREPLRIALEGYGNQSATTLTSSIPSNIIPAAYYSRVACLFVQRNSEIWGTFDVQKNSLKIHEQQMDGDENLVDKAIVRTILNGGEVHVVEKEEMPANSKMAAIMRY
jgi:Bacterial archaeo-eukaryotic release factor family 7